MKQEEKAERYDEVLEELRGLLECIHEEKREILEEDITSIFPELKESSDERIRQELIAIYSVGAKANMKTGDIPDKDIVAWLEKQGEKKPTNKVEPKFKVKYAGNEYNVLEVKDVSDVTFYGIEDEPNHIDYVKAENCERVDGYSIKENGSTYPTKSAVFSEQTIIDKVEPKFKQGQWIVWKDKCYEVNYNGCGYELIDQNGLSTSLEYGTIDENAHLWTIQDAKDGDVLVTGKGNIFIFKSISGYSVYDYCGLYYGEFMDCSACVNNPASEPIGYHPATKEEREQLEKAMADAGFTFDFDKKELKTIVTTKFEVGDVICDKSCTTLNKETQPNMEIVDIKNGMYICDKGSFPVSQQDEYELVSKKIDTKLNDDSVSNELREASVKHAEKELKNHTFPNNEEFELAYTFEEGAKWNTAQKSAWSEEDEGIFDEIIDFLENGTVKLQHDLSLYASWLKSLKGRVDCEANCTTTKEWSVEDENRFINLISLVKCSKENNATKAGFIEFINKLKSLKPQNAWKPSDEHYELEEFAKIARSNLTGISKAVQELFEAKYLQLTGNKMYGGFKD